MEKRRIGVVIPTGSAAGLFTAETRERLANCGQVRWSPSEKHLSEAEAIELLAGCGIGISSWGTVGPSAAILAACPDLKIWIHAAGSVKSFFGPHLEARPDLKIVSCNGAIADYVAQFAVAQIVLGLKRAYENAATNRAGRAGKPRSARNLITSTVGVVSASAVGREVIRLLQPFGCRVLVYDPFLSPEQALQLGATLEPDLNKLCAQSHAVTLHPPILPETRHMIGAEQLRAMRDNAVLVNTSRGEVINEVALIAELQKGRLYALLDVSAPEPATDDSPLRTLPNVVYTSHIAGGPDEHIGNQVAADVEAIVAGRLPRNVVTREMLARLA